MDHNKYPNKKELCYIFREEKQDIPQMKCIMSGVIKKFLAHKK